MSPMTYKPPPDAAGLFARYKEHYEGERELKPAMVEMADRELKAGATVGELAKLTGLTPEVFRRRARALGVERKRPPTVGKLAETAEPRPAAPRLPPAPEPRPTRKEPAPVVPMTEERAEQLAALARERAEPEQVQMLTQRTSHVGEAHRDFAVVAEALGMGLLTQAEADTDPAARPEEEH